ncbi:MAG: UDP-N-acetylglucosamine 2-epimerase, partial [Pseudomonadota bacterium]
MKKKKICVVITTRGNYGKTKSIMKAIRQDPSMELQLIVGGSAVLPKYGDLRKVIESEGYPIDKTVTFLVEGENLTTMTQSAGLALMEMGRIYEDLKPDMVLVIADRFEALAIAMGAVYMNIPIAHLEGGEISGSIDESIRHAITKLSHIHFPATQTAADRIIRMGEDPASVFVTGTPSLDVLKEMDLTNTDILFEAQRTMGVGSDIDFNGEYLIVLQHPVVTEYVDNLGNIRETIAAVDELKYPTVWVWPNMDAGSDGISKGLRVYREKERPRFIHFFKSLP